MVHNKRAAKAGFSLVELMVVVAIIGILATIAVPNFQRFQAKARQSNAKVELSGVYTAEKSFFTEYSVYHGNLPGIGFLPDGFRADGTLETNVTRYYASSAGDGSTAAASGWPSTLPAPTVTYTTNQFAATTTACPGAIANATASYTGGTAIGTVQAASAAATFQAVAAGCPRASTQSAADVWSINENKVLANVQQNI